MERLFGPETAGGFEVGSHLPRSAARVVDGEVLHLASHLERLRTSASALGWGASWIGAESGPLAAWVRERAEARLLALRLQLREGRFRAALEAIPPTPSPYLLRLLPHPLGHPGDEPLAPHKGLTGAWGAELVAAARGAGASDALLHWPDGVLVETGIASIGLERGAELWIPPREGRIASLAERLDLPDWAKTRGLRVETRAFHRGDLADGRLWCFNALRGFWVAGIAEAG